MHYLTNYYKNLAEQLQQRVHTLTSIIETAMAQKKSKKRLNEDTSLFGSNNWPLSAVGSIERAMPEFNFYLSRDLAKRMSDYDHELLQNQIPDRQDRDIDNRPVDIATDRLANTGENYFREVRDQSGRAFYAPDAHAIFRGLTSVLPEVSGNMIKNLGPGQYGFRGYMAFHPDFKTMTRNMPKYEDVSDDHRQFAHGVHALQLMADTMLRGEHQGRFINAFIDGINETKNTESAFNRALNYANSVLGTPSQSSLPGSNA